MIKLSVIVVARNQEKYIEDCIESIQESDFNHNHLQLIVVDDASTDDTFKEAFSCFPVKLIRNSKQLGIARSCNKALKAAKGEYVVRVDGDDTIESNLLLFHNEILDNNENIDFVVGDHNLIGNRVGKVRVNKNDVSTLLACGYTYRKDALIAIGGWNHFVYEEMDLHLRLFASGRRAFYLPLFLYNYRKHHGNMSNDRKLMEKGYKQLLDRYSQNMLNAYGVI